MAPPQPVDALGADLNVGFAQQLVGEQPATHADLAVDAPDRQLDILLVERLLPGQHMLVDAVDQRAVEIEQESGLHTHCFSPGCFSIGRT
ncbi:hypothetical protein X772_33440 [Mesorhizobium sp. LSJC280B00]|nr:hypothetical protein X772_33440 [Mesorhizobium sp. LSJC280B00]